MFGYLRSLVTNDEDIIRQPQLYSPEVYRNALERVRKSEDDMLQKVLYDTRLYNNNPEVYRKTVKRSAKLNEDAYDKFFKGTIHYLPFENYLDLIYLIAARVGHDDVINLLYKNVFFDYRHHPDQWQAERLLKYNNELAEKVETIRQIHPIAMKENTIRKYIVVQSGYMELCKDLKTRKIPPYELAYLAYLLKIPNETISTVDKSELCDLVGKQLKRHIL